CHAHFRSIRKLLPTLPPEPLSVRTFCARKTSRGAKRQTHHVGRPRAPTLPSKMPSPCKPEGPQGLGGPNVARPSARVKNGTRRARCGPGRFRGRGRIEWRASNSGRGGNLLKTIALIATVAAALFLVPASQAITDGELDGNGHPAVVLVLMEVN